MDYKKMSIAEIEAAKTDLYKQRKQLRDEMLKADAALSTKVNEERRSARIATIANELGLSANVAGDVAKAIAKGEGN